MTIKFHMDCPPYRKGDVAGFSSEKEKWLVEDKEVAKYMKKPTKDKMMRNSKQKNKTYECKCGREFDSPQGLGAHKRFCKEGGK